MADSTGDFYCEELSYETFSIVGRPRGGMGEVLILADREGTPRYALKRLLNGCVQHSDDLRQEADILAQLPTHPNVVPVLRYFVHDNAAYIAMPVYRHSLADIIRTDLVSTVRDTAALQVVKGMRHIHEVGKLLHRDLKPQNVLVANDGTFAVSDFGMAHRLGNDSLEAALTLNFAGTPAYASPEMVLARTATARSDVWAFGILLFELWTGRLPFVGRDVAEYLRAAVSEKVAFTPAERAVIPEHVAHTILACTARAPHARPQFSEIENILEGHATPSAVRVDDPRVDFAPEIDRANALSSLGKHAEAQDIYSHVVQNEPANVSALLNLAESFRLQGNIDKAIEYAVTAYRAAIGMSQDRGTIGTLLLNLSEYYLGVAPLKAVTVARKGVELCPDDWHIAGNLAEACRLSAITLWDDDRRAARRFVEEGLDTLVILLKAHPTDVLARVTCAGLLKLWGDREQFLEYLNDIMSDPSVAETSIGARKLFIDALIDEGQFEHAERQIENLRGETAFAPLIPQWDRNLRKARIESQKGDI